VPEESLPVDPDVPRSERLPIWSRGHSLAFLLRSRWDVLLVVAAGGAIGSITRWGVGRLLPWSVDRFPWATLLENVSGALALGGLMVVLLDRRPASRYARPFLGVGVLGGYTTFSTYALESRDLLAAGRLGTAIAYLSVSLVAGVVAVWLGMGSARLAVGVVRRGNAGATG
jgi:fluoride exporter